VSRSEPFIIAPALVHTRAQIVGCEPLALAILQRAKQMRCRLGHVVAARRAG
jgi:hypothetical protein